MSGERARTTRCRGSPGCAIAGEKSGNVSDCVRLMIVLNSRERGWLAYLHVVQEAVVLEGRDEDLPVGEHAPLEDSDLVGVVYHPLVVLNEPRDESVALKGVRVPAKGREDRGERGGEVSDRGRGKKGGARHGAGARSDERKGEGLTCGETRRISEGDCTRSSRRRSATW